MENLKKLYDERLKKFEKLQKDYSELEKLSQDKIAAAIDEEVTFAPEDIDYLDTSFGMIWLESIKSIHAAKDGVEETWLNPNYSSISFCSTNTPLKYHYKNGSTRSTSNTTNTRSSQGGSAWI